MATLVSLALWPSEFVFPATSPETEPRDSAGILFTLGLSMLAATDLSSEHTDFFKLA